MTGLPQLIAAWDNEGWRDHAACRREDTDLFFAVGPTKAAAEQTTAAKAVCRSCPVRDACLQYALDTDQDVGVWGGADEDERRRLRRGRRTGGQRRIRSASA